jgi:hypothetical protein
MPGGRLSDARSAGALFGGHRVIVPDDGGHHPSQRVDDSSPVQDIQISSPVENPSCFVEQHAGSS